MTTDILSICESQLGAHANPAGDTKYGIWLDTQSPVTDVYHDADWCGASLMWCLAQGPPEWLATAGGLNKNFAYVQNWLDWFRSKGWMTSVAAPRRLVWYDWAGTPRGANHIGLVKDTHSGGNRMWVYEGNHGSPATFELVDRPIDGQVMAFGEWWSHVPVASLDDDCWVT